MSAFIPMICIPFIIALSEKVIAGQASTVNLSLIRFLSALGMI